MKQVKETQQTPNPRKGGADLLMVNYDVMCE